MEFLHFAIKYTPFWAVPSLMICGFYGYMYWLKSFKYAAYTLMTFGVISFITIIFYIFTGGPKGSVQTFIEIVGELKSF